MKTKNFILGIALSSLFFLLITGFAQAQETIITKSELPKTAQNFLNKHFSEYTISYIKKDNEVFSVDYEVKFTNLMEVKFDSNGNWEEVDGEHQPIPTAYISTKITNYINKQFPGAKITKIEKDTLKQEVKISNGLELIFNSSGDFIKIDD